MTPEQEAQARRLELPVLCAVLLVVPALALDSMHLSGWAGVTIDTLNWLVWLTFLAEALIMLRIAPDNWQWVRHNKLDIAVLVLTPPFLPEALHVLWVLRLLRVLDVLPILNRVFHISGFKYAAMLAFLTVYGGGLAFAEIEHAQDGVNSGFDGMWWAMTTMTTVGYGDLYPQTVMGRILGMSVMAMGPILIAIVSSSVTMLLQHRIEETIEESTQKTSQRIQDIGDDVRELADEIDDVEQVAQRAAANDQAVESVLQEVLERLTRIEQATAAGQPAGEEH